MFLSSARRKVYMAASLYTHCMVIENSNTVRSVHFKWILFMLILCIICQFSLSIDVVCNVFIVATLLLCCLLGQLALTER